MRFYEIHETVHSIYMVVEYLTGGELIKNMSKKIKYNELYLKKVIRSISIGIAYMHERGIMHRDLKPENLMIKSKKERLNVKIIDFGLATKVDVDSYIYRRCGTPGFVAPEIITLKEGKFYDEKCDIFSIGVIFFIL